MKSDRARPRAHSKSSPIPAFPAAPEIADDRLAVIANLRAGVAKIDLTPSEARDCTVVGYRREVNGVRDRLRAAHSAWTTAVRAVEAHRTRCATGPVDRTVLIAPSRS